MRCTICGKEAADESILSLLIGVACRECIPRGKETTFQIRSATEPEDGRFVLEFLDNLFGETEFIEFGRWYRVDDMDKLVAVAEKGQYVGFAVYVRERDEPNLMTLLTINVDESFLRRGVASALLAEVRKIAIHSGVKRIRVPISNDDLLSYVFYHRRGFTLSGVDLGLCMKRHGKEMEGFWKLPLRDEFYLSYELT